MYLFVSSSIRCDKVKAGIKEGWSGKPIQFSRPYRFFQMFAAGKEAAPAKGTAAKAAPGKEGAKPAKKPDKK